MVELEYCDNCGKKIGMKGVDWKKLVSEFVLLEVRNK